MPDFQRSALAALAVLLMLSSLVVTPALAGPGTIQPPVSTGPQQLVGSGGFATTHDWFHQTDNFQGAITNVGSSQRWTLRVENLDLALISGPVERSIYLHLQNNNVSGHQNMLGLEISLQSAAAAGGTHIEAFANFGSGGSTQEIFLPTALDLSQLDLRIEFEKISPTGPWRVEAAWRDGGTAWNDFLLGSFDSSTSFDFDAAFLRLGYAGGADGPLAFSDMVLEGEAPVTEVQQSWGSLKAFEAR